MALRHGMDGLSVQPDSFFSAIHLSDAFVSVLMFIAQVFRPMARLVLSVWWLRHEAAVARSGLGRRPFTRSRLTKFVSRPV